jgi:hypothetical protein
MSRLNRSLIRALDRYEKAHAPEPQVFFFWLNAQRPTFKQQRDALIASGRARPTDTFVGFCWSDYKPPKEP